MLRCFSRHQHVNHMATAASRDIVKLLECVICMEMYRDPRLLPCSHNFCFKCIERLYEDSEPEDQVRCPLCCKELAIPENGVEGLQKNLILQQLMDALAKSNPKQECGTCSKEYCTQQSAECDQRMSTVRADEFDHPELSSAHTSVTRMSECVGDSTHSSEPVVNLTSRCCSSHMDEALEFYCFDCRVAICGKCFATKHSAHECITDEVVRGRISQIRGDIRLVVDGIATCRELIRGMVKKKIELNGYAKEIEREIHEHVEKLKRQLELGKQALLVELESSKKEWMKQIEQVICVIEHHMLISESLVKHGEELMKKGSVSDIADQTSSVRDTAVELSKLDVIDRIINDLGSVVITFIPSTESLIQSSATIIGQVCTTTVAAPSVPGLSTIPGSSLSGLVDLSPSDDSDPEPAEFNDLPLTAIGCPTLRHVIPPVLSRSIVGLTLLNDQLFVLREPCGKQIEVYSTLTFTLQRAVSITNLGRPMTGHNGLTSCATNNCLYVSDYRKNRISKITLSVDGHVLKWKVGYGPQGLSVNRKCNVLVSSDGMTLKKVQEFTSSGFLLREVHLWPDVYGSINATNQLTNYNQLVVSHDMPTNGISVLDWEGNLVTSCRNSKANKFWKNPGSLVVDKNDFVLAADQGNNRIVVLDSTLSGSWELPLLVGDGSLEGPYCMHFDESRGRLYVGEFDGKRVLVFDNVYLNYRSKGETEV